MKFYLLILLCLLAPRKFTSAHNHKPKLDKYLQRQFEGIHEQMLGRNRNIRQIGDVTDESRTVGHYILGEAIQDPIINIFTLFNRTHLAIDDEIFVANMNKTLEIDSFGHFEQRRSVYFKSYEYERTGYIAMSTNTEILIYTLNENQTTPELVQTIFNPYSSDGTFFHNAGNLYFISTSNRGQHIGYIRTFKWLGFHFDELEPAEVHIRGAIKIDSFPYKQSEIIIVCQDLPDYKVHSNVYRFHRDKIRNIQLLNTEKPIQMNIYFQNESPYVLIYEVAGRQRLFKWNGFELFLVNSFHWGHKIHKSIVVYGNTSPLIVQPQLDKVLVFQPQNDAIKLSETKGYLANYSVILDVKRGENANGNITFIVGLNDENIINIYGMYFKAHTEMEQEQEDALRNCFDNLELKVHASRKKLNQMSQTSFTENVQKNISKRQVSQVDETSSIETQLKDIKLRLKNIKPLLMNHVNSSNALVINGKAIIKGNSSAKRVKAKKIVFKNINGRKWTPEQWLSYTREQLIKGPIKIDTVRTKILVTNATIFNNILRNNGRQTISGRVKVKNLVTKGIFTNKINEIHVHDIYNQNDPVPIKGVKSFENIDVNKANISKINGKETKDVLPILRNVNNTTNRKFAANVRIDNLQVISIDGINWSKFEKSLFKIGEDNLIEGNIVTPGLEVNKLETKILNGIRTDFIMTKTTSQIINSSIEFNNIKAGKIICETVNNIDISKAVKNDQNGTVIKSHVIIDEVEVLKDLTLKGKFDQSLFLNIDQHIFGTSPSDLYQRYMGKVLVHGNLYVNDFSCLQNTTIFLKGNEFTIGMLDEYWNKRGNQTIPVHFEAVKGASTPHLKTKSLNEIPIEKFALNLEKTLIRSPLFFENVTIEGNVILDGDSNSNPFNLRKLAQEGVKLNGMTYHINGRKTFKNMLTVKKLLNRVADDSGNKTNNDISGIKGIKKVIIRGNLITNITRAEIINRINISHYNESIIPLNKPQNLTSLTFKNLTVDRLEVETINGQNITEFLVKLQNIFKEKRIGTVDIKGNVTLNDVRNLEAINGHRIEELFQKDNSTEADFIGNVTFTTSVHIGNLVARTINKIDFPGLTKRFLHKSSNQTVTGIYTFNNLKTGWLLRTEEDGCRGKNDFCTDSAVTWWKSIIFTVHLNANMINDKNVSNLIDISAKQLQEIQAPHGIVFKNIALEKFISAKEMIPCNIYDAIEMIRYPGTQEWASVEITGNATFLDDTCDLHRILSKSVKKDEENIILAPVRMNGHVSTKQVTSNGGVNNMNLKEFFDDVVFNDSEEEQVITGHKIFTNVLQADTIHVTGNADIIRVNDIQIPRLYKNIIRKNQVNNITVLGKKTFFGGLQTDKLMTEKIAGMNPEDIVSLDNLKQVPKVVFDQISVTNDLDVKYINSYELNYILNNRLFTNTTEKQFTNGIYFFSNLEVVDNLETQSINNVDIQNVVFDIGRQKIIAPKIFLQNITIHGNTNIGYLNKINITNAYNNALMHGRNEIMNGSVTLSSGVRLDGKIDAQTINGYPIDQIRPVLGATSNRIEEEIKNIEEELKAIIKYSSPTVKSMPNEFMYIERAEDLQITLRHVIDARITKIKEYVLLQALREESHEKCNLPEGCKCPVQYTVDITPSGSVSHFLNKGQQRIYNYDDESLTIHLVVNSISSDSYCRTRQSEKVNEESILTWSITRTGNITGDLSTEPSYFTGYISGAEFFTLNGITYGIIARYYDSVMNTHDLDCIVIRIDEDKKSSSVIQRIPTKGARTLYLMHTAQGVTVVIGQLGEKQPYTEIYRFIQEIEMFQLLRSIAYGCTKTAGVILGTESLFILTSPNAPTEVLKYHPNHDNYYHYQTLTLDEPVLGLSVFYIRGLDGNEPYLCMVTEDRFWIYSFQYIDGWRLESQGFIPGLRNLIPFELNDQQYLFAPSVGESSLLKVINHGSR